MPVFSQILVGCKKETESVPCKECKSGQIPRCCCIGKIKQPETKPQQSCLHPRMFKDVKNKDRDMTRHRGEEGESGEERDSFFLLFLDLVLTIILNLEMLISSEESETDLSSLFIYIQQIFIDLLLCSLAHCKHLGYSSKRDTNFCPYETHIEGRGWGRNAYIRYTCCSEPN